MMRDSIPDILVPHGEGAALSAIRSWRMAVAALALALAWILVCYWRTGAAIVTIWARSDTFAHGFIIAPITLWLVWRARAQLSSVRPHPSWWVLAPLAASGFGWLLGELGSVNAVSQFALVALLVLTVPAVLGVEAARTISFPLAFLFFAVPIGDFAIPKMMEWTADFTVLALRLSGIPVLREGQNFVISSGSWSVVEACSGVRYLIASLVMGTLYAYLSYRSPLRRLAFIGVSILIPIVANWLRAYLIVMLGHLSGNKIAVGVDHLIYGWLFFGVVILAMFWIGARWREDGDRSDAHAPLPVASATMATPGRFALVTMVIAAATILWPLAYRAIERNEGASMPQLAALGAVGSWDASPGGLTDWQPQFQSPSMELHQTFRRGSETVGVYVGYYRNQSYSRKLVSSDNVLVATTDRAWVRVGSGSQPLTVGSVSLSAGTAELRGANGVRLVAWHWYWIDGQLTASDAWTKGYTALSRLLGRGDDSAIIVVYAPKGQPGAAEALLDGFLRDAGPEIASVLQRAREHR